MREWLDNSLQATDWCCECIKIMIIIFIILSTIYTDRPAALDSALHKVQCGVKLVVEDAAPVSRLAWTSRSCAQHFSHSVKLSDVTGNPFEWRLDENNVI